MGIAVGLAERVGRRVGATDGDGDGATEGFGLGRRVGGAVGDAERTGAFVTYTYSILNFSGAAGTPRRRTAGTGAMGDCVDGHGSDSRI